MNVSVALVMALAGLAAACTPMQPASPSAVGNGGRSATVGERAYRTPPAVLAVQPGAGGRVRLDGIADPGARVRLATPAGQAVFASADAAGRWRVVAPPSTSLRLFGLSMTDERQIVQSESYLALTPGGTAARLMAGAGAVVLAPPCTLCLTALDYDRKGGAVISGRAQPGAVVELAIDGVMRGRVATDAAGGFWLDLDEPLRVGAHRIVAAAGARRVEADVALGAPVPLADGPFAADRTASGWRIEWVTPGGGIQTTVLFDRSGADA